MRALVQRVLWAEVQVNTRIVGQIGHGLLVYTAVAPTDRYEDARALADKVANLRVFPDEQGKMNRSVRDAGGGVLAVPSFTLLALTSKKRPTRTSCLTFDNPTPARVAQPLQEAFVATLRELAQPVESGVFGADMIVRSAADGPVNFVLDMPPQADPAVRG